MNNFRLRTQGLFCGLVYLLATLVSAALADEVIGFQDVPTYPGLDLISTAPGDPDQVERILQEGGGILYECSDEDSGERYVEDPEAFAADVVAFYKKKLGNAGWKYLGEGAYRHHWMKDEDVMALSFLDYCAVEYRRLGTDEARANMGTIDEKDFFIALTGCVTAAQAVCNKHGVGDFGDFEKKSEEFASRGDMEGLEAFEANLERECRSAMWTALKPHGVTPERLTELFEDREDLADQWLQEYGAFMAENALGWVMVQQLAE